MYMGPINDMYNMRIQKFDFTKLYDRIFPYFTVSLYNFLKHFQLEDAYVSV